MALGITAPLAEEALVRVAESIRESGPMPKRCCITWLPICTSSISAPKVKASEEGLFKPITAKGSYMDG